MAVAVHAQHGDARPEFLPGAAAHTRGHAEPHAAKSLRLRHNADDVLPRLRHGQCRLHAGERALARPCRRRRLLHGSPQAAHNENDAYCLLHFRGSAHVAVDLLMGGHQGAGVHRRPLLQLHSSVHPLGSIRRQGFRHNGNGSPHDGVSGAGVFVLFDRRPHTERAYPHA